MILNIFRCDRCEEEDGPHEEDTRPEGFIVVSEPCEHHGEHEYHYCSWTCAMHACAAALDREEAWEENHAEE